MRQLRRALVGLGITSVLLLGLVLLYVARFRAQPEPVRAEGPNAACADVLRAYFASVTGNASPTVTETVLSDSIVARYITYAPDDLVQMELDKRLTPDV